MEFKKLAIQVTGTLTVGSEVLKIIRVTRQTHRGGAFGKDGPSFQAKNGITLASAYGPHLDTENSVYYVQGEAHDQDTLTQVVTGLAYKNILEAVEEYNTFFNANKICEGTCGPTVCEFCMTKKDYLTFTFAQERGSAIEHDEVEGATVHYETPAPINFGDLLAAPERLGGWHATAAEVSYVDVERRLAGTYMGDVPTPTSGMRFTTSRPRSPRR